ALARPRVRDGGQHLDQRQRFGHDLLLLFGQEEAYPFPAFSPSSTKIQPWGGEDPSPPAPSPLRAEGPTVLEVGDENALMVPGMLPEHPCGSTLSGGKP